VSVIIPTKNGGELLMRVVEEVLNQKTDFDYDLTIIDSGSTDGAIDAISKLGNSKIQIIEIPSEEFGHGRTRNQAIGQTAGQYIAVVTQDATPASDYWLQNLVRDIERDSRIAGVFGKHLTYPEADIFTKRDFQMHFDSFLEEPVVWLEDKKRYQEDQGYRQKLHFFSDNNALLRRLAWEEIPYPDVSYAEDQQWAKLVIEAGWRKKYSDEGSVFHSHNYRLIDLFRRSIDESRAMKEYFNYQLSPNLKNVLKSWVGFSIRDTKYVFHRKRSVPKNLLPLLSQYVRNFLKPLGHHIGNRYSEMPQGLVQFLSYDYRLRIGKRQGGGVAKSKSGI
jgi:rhamnosyltransferase